MKKITFFLMILLVSLTFYPSTSFAAKKDPIATTKTTKEVSPEAKVLLARLEEIKAMDKSLLTSEEKKALRKEARAIRANSILDNIDFGDILLYSLLFIAAYGLFLL
jgi:Skp family chaperone for outer membrane proteins